MKLKKPVLGLMTAVATFALGIGAFAAVQFANSFIPLSTAKAETTELIINEQVSTAVPVFTAPIFVGPSANEPEEYTEEFDPSGQYYLDSEKEPVAFAEIEYLEIQSREYKYDENDNLVNSLHAPKGLIQTTKPLKFTRIAIGGKEIAFQTETIGGVSYKFTGGFLTGAYCETTDGDRPDLKGRLIKIIDGKWAAEMDAEFYVECGC